MGAPPPVGTPYAKKRSTYRAIGAVFAIIGVLVLIFGVYSLIVAGAAAEQYDDGIGVDTYSPSSPLIIFVNDPSGTSNPSTVTVNYEAYYIADDSLIGVSVYDCGTNSACSGENTATALSGPNSACDGDCDAVTFSGNQGSYYEIVPNYTAFMSISINYDDAVEAALFYLIMGIIIAAAVGGGLFAAARRLTKRTAKANLGLFLNYAIGPGEKVLDRQATYFLQEDKLLLGYLVLTNRRVFFAKESPDGASYSVVDEASWDLKDVHLVGTGLLGTGNKYRGILIAGKGFTMQIRTAKEFEIALKNAIQVIRPPEVKTLIRSAPAQPQVVTREIIKEIVKIPCPYCRALVESTAARCENCGAPMGRM